MSNQNVKKMITKPNQLLLFTGDIQNTESLLSMMEDRTVPFDCIQFYKLQVKQHDIYTKHKKLRVTYNICHKNQTQRDMRIQF